MSCSQLFFRYLILFAGLLPGFSVTPAYAGHDGMALLKQQCASCHNLSGPAPHTLSALAARKGPDLFYAGDKYRQAWLKRWLQHPTRIRPSGMAYDDYIRSRGATGRADMSAQSMHPALSEADAAGAADALMQLKASTLRINRFLHQPQVAISEVLPRGGMLFKHVYGCQACHQVAPGTGGASAPELYSAGQRLTQAFIRSYIRSPQLWDPMIWMPSRHVSGENIEKLAAYIAALGAPQQGAHHD